ncbi:MAG: N-acetylmuramoyl-L-alanine amidase, partial [Thermodesulfobacteriota bacterium]|nr:N-acetylmuramoyl-L-alanine amidase [Thermodesulfobacteriota bacterium]
RQNIYMNTKQTKKIKKNYNMGNHKKHIISFFLICCFILFAVPVESFAETAEDKYFKAEACYRKLKKSAKKQKYRENWLACIKKFQAVYRHDPSGKWAAAGLYMSGNLYMELYKRSYKKSDKKEAIDNFERIKTRYPKSAYNKKAAIFIKKPGTKEPATKENSYSKKKKAALKAISKKVEEKPHKKPLAKNVTVTGLRFWSNPNYTRVVIDTDKETSYLHHLLKKDPSIKKPQRLYVDLQNCNLGKNIEKIIPIDDDLLSGARAGQYTKDSVRVVVDIKSFKTYKVFSLKDPFRIIMDMWGDSGKPSKTSDLKVKNRIKDPKATADSIVKQLSLGVKRIIIDPGHGGRDYGAPGRIKGVHEKKIVLKIGQKLARKIRKELKCEVIMTRNSDKFLTLEERTAIANTKNADLFISIHTNANRDRRAYGIETYFLSPAGDKESILVAARENATSTNNISDLDVILSDLLQNSKINESSRLAAYIQESIYKNLKKRGYSRVKNKGVKQAPFYVLIGAQMPAVLIETSFISNQRECKRLINSKYQDRLCEGIVSGIKKYIKETNPTAFIRKGTQSNPQG